MELYEYLNDIKPINESHKNMVNLIGLIITKGIDKQEGWAWLSVPEFTKLIDTKIESLRTYGNLKTGYIMSRAHKKTIMEAVYGHWIDASDSHVVADFICKLVEHRQDHIYEFYKYNLGRK